MELAIDTSTKYASLGLSLNGQIKAESQWFSGWNHTVEIGMTVRKLLKANLVLSNEIDSIFVAIGPGGYSSLRTGLSFAKGFAEAIGAKLYAVSTLDIQAYPFFSLNIPICSVLQVGRDQIAWSLYSPFERIGSAVKINSPSEIIDGCSIETIFCGEGAMHINSWLSANSKHSRFVVNRELPARQVRDLIKIGVKMKLQGQYNDLTTLEPNYLRKPSIHVSKK
jgi:tRNA threonylcarbamoyladenosine biosynthesis protein TsaB